MSCIEKWHVRPAECSDAPAIAQVHVATWLTTYRGLMPDSILDGLSVARREQLWTRTLCPGSEQPSGVFVYVAEHDAHHIAGFASGGPQREGDTDHPGELSAVYVLKEHQRKGLGRALVAAVAQHFARDSISRMLLWVLASNTASRAFYERLGGTILRSRMVQFGEASLEEVAYCWTDTGALARAALRT